MFKKVCIHRMGDQHVLIITYDKVAVENFSISSLRMAALIVGVSSASVLFERLIDEIDSSAESATIMFLNYTRSQSNHSCC